MLTFDLFKPLAPDPSAVAIPSGTANGRKKGTERPADEARPSCIIDPDAEWKQYWDLVILFLIPVQNQKTKTQSLIQMKQQTLTRIL